MDLPIAILLPEYKQLIVAFFDLEAIGQDISTTRGASAGPGPVTCYLDVVNLEVDVELDCFEYLLIPGTDGVATDQGRRILRHKNRLAPVKVHYRVNIVSVERGFIGLNDGFDGHDIFLDRAHINSIGGFRYPED